MKRGDRPELLWGLGLSDQDASVIQDALGPKFYLRNYPTGKLPWVKEGDKKEKPSAAWIPWRVWKGLPGHLKEAYREWEETPRILLQDESDESVEFENVVEQGFLTMIRAPLSRNKVQDALFRAKEVKTLYSDIYRMTEEIFLERELLARKTDQLLFLNTILARAAESLEAEDILSRAREDLNMLLPVRILQAVFWTESAEQGFVEAEIFLHSRMVPSIMNAWVEFLTESAARLSGAKVGSYHIHNVHRVSKPGGKDFSPKSGRVVALPLRVGNEHFGCLVLLCDKGVRLAKDQVQTMNAAVSHLALALRNALLFRRVRTKADKDGLTRIYNRRAFDERLVDELLRHQRYHSSMALLLVDLDHFKAVNDTYGHQAGDMVLRKTADILQDTLRATDFPARYGGEEFVVLLPHTTEEQAWNLAERIRSRIAQAVFTSAEACFQVTASIGVAAMAPGVLRRENELILQADRALYLAKAGGRNMVVSSSRAEERKVSQ